MDNKYYVYILCNTTKSVLYIGVINDISRRLAEHKQGLIKGFTKRYNVHTLIYAEAYADVKTAIMREKQLKHWSRQKKEQLINSVNPEWEEILPY